MSVLSKARDQVQELRELGFRGTAFRLAWEARTRLGLAALVESAPAIEHELPLDWVQKIPFSDPDAVQRCVSGRIPSHHLDRLQGIATEACDGRILAFGHWPATFGMPPDWHRNPESGSRWNPKLHWSRAMRDGRRVGDIKLTWEIGRFPHAYHLARASVFEPASSGRNAAALSAQIESFIRSNPYGRGVHWGSGQEIAFRILAWHFASRVFGAPEFSRARRDVARGTIEGAHYIEQHIEYARRAVHNNHLLSEALALYWVGTLFPSLHSAAGWRELGRSLLEEHVPKQFYRDGGYIQLSHNYHRLALQVVLCAVAIARSQGEQVPEVWLTALGRSVDFLVAQQNEADGRLPNYGANDGALPLVLSTCDYSDFRPTLQAASLASRGERIYPEGPWDEEAAWLLGAEALSAPLRQPNRVSVSFPHTGFHVLRGRREGDFAVLRCGTIRDRFSQIDMLHLDLWWNGFNVLADPGSYLYNGPVEWHNHFMRTASHNTVSIDGRDQMEHHRRFKCLYPTRARLVRFEDGPVWSLCEGEHHGYGRHPGAPEHRRTVLMVKGAMIVVVDQVAAQGSHVARLHWLVDPTSWRLTRDATILELDTPIEKLALQVLGSSGQSLRQDVAFGEAEPPRGWLSRYYGRKRPCVSSAVVIEGACPLTMVSVLAAPETVVSQTGGEWRIDAGGTICRFRQGPAGVSSVVVERAGDA